MKVSFIIPVLNEEKTLASTLDSLVAVDYPNKEIILAVCDLNGVSGKIAESYAKKYPFIKTVNNITGNTAIGRNICIEHSSGELLMNYSGHVLAERNLLSLLVGKLKSMPDDVASVGCSNIFPDKQGFVGRSSGLAFLCVMGGKGLFSQNASYPDERFVDHVSFACYRREAVESVGGFDTVFWCGQDYEMDIRLRKAGYKILYTPDTRVYHHKRDTLYGLFKQMYRYGVARAKICLKHPDTFRVFHLFGSVFIVGFLVLLLFGWEFLPFFVLLYCILSWLSTLWKADSTMVLLLIPLFYFIIHTGYGLGFIRGLLFKKPFRDRVWGAFS